jgi:hypothetical protein
MSIRRCLSWLSPTRVTLAVLGAGYLAIVALTLADQRKSRQATPSDIAWTASEVQAAEAALRAAQDMVDRLTTVEQQIQVEVRTIRAQSPRPKPAPGSFDDLSAVTKEFTRKTESARKEYERLTRQARSFAINDVASYNAIERRITAYYDEVLDPGGDALESLKKAHDESLKALPALMREAWPVPPPVGPAERLRVATIILDIEYQRRLWDHYLAEAQTALDKQGEALGAKSPFEQMPEHPR